MFLVPALQDQRNAAGAQNQEMGEVHRLHAGSTRIDLSKLFIFGKLFRKTKRTKYFVHLIVVWMCRRWGSSRLPAISILILDLKIEFYSFFYEFHSSKRPGTFHTFQTGGFPGGPCNKRVRNVCHKFSRGKALDCETLPYMEEISRNATILGVHAIYMESMIKETVVMGGACVWVEQVSKGWQALLWKKYITAATTLVGGWGRFPDSKQY